MTATVIKLSGALLVEPMVHDLCARGSTPISALEHAIEDHIFNQFRDGFGERLTKPPVVKLFRNYSKKNRYASLLDLAASGYETSYLEVHLVTRPGDAIKEIRLTTDGIKVLPISYGAGVKIKVVLKVSPLKMQTNHRFRINLLRVSGQVCQDVLNRLSANNQPEQPMIANFAPGPDIAGYSVVSYDHMLTGAKLFCSCARPFHAKIFSQATELIPSYVAGSWPQAISSLLKNASYKNDICHICLARKISPEAATRRYGGEIETCFGALVDQVAFDLGVDQQTARAEVMHILGLSRWVRESELYGVIRALFPDHRVLREASPEWLGRMRLDIYLPELNLAIEHQGEQHYQPVVAFGGDEAYARVLERDALKRQSCQEHGVTVIDVRYDSPITVAVMRQRLRRFLSAEHSG